MKLLIRPSANKIALRLALVVCLLLVTGLLSIYLRFGLGYENAFGFVHLFDLGGEYNVPALYSSFAIWLCAAILSFIYSQEKASVSRYTRHWKILSLVFFYLGLDELASLHESLSQISPIIWKYVPSLRISRRWVLPFLPFLLAFAVYFFRFYLSLPKESRINFLIAAVTYVTGAVGIEVLGEWYANVNGLPQVARHLSAVAEEGFEMAGIVLFIRALIRYIEAKHGSPVIDLRIYLPNQATLFASEPAEKSRVLIVGKEPAESDLHPEA